MGERKGQNKYYPPDFFNQSSKAMAKGLDAYHGHHRLRERGKKAHLGIIVIRFEMPFNIWCEKCKNHIGMGVRYNAEKQKAGNYYSTTIYEFKMKCHLCDNYFVIRTDPANLDYVIVSGARRQENRWDPTQNEQIVPETKETQRKLFDDAMYKLEHGIKDKKTADDEKPALCRLFQRNEDLWKDNFEENSKLRLHFRKTKSVLKSKEEADSKILARTSLSGLKLLPETQEDRHLASLLKLKTTKSITEKSLEKFKEIIEKPALPCSSTITLFEMKRRKLESEKSKNSELGIIKKKRCDEESSQKITHSKGLSLVLAYGSNSSEEENEK